MYGVHPIDCRSEVTGIYTEDYKSQQQTHVDKKEQLRWDKTVQSPNTLEMELRRVRREM